jgi:hypothetical protein
VRRYDDFSTLLQQCVRALFFFHPAVHWMCRHLDFEREVACDDAVLAATNAATCYARSLTRIAEVAAWRRRPALASGAAFTKRHISRRIELLLNAARDRRPRISGISFALVLLVIIGITSEFAIMPAFVSFVEGGTRYRSRWTADGRTFQMEMTGDIEFGDDDASVARMSPHAVLRVEERTGWTGRKVEIRSDAYGRPQTRYFLHGNERPLDEPGRAWLAGILPRLIRDSGIRAEERAIRILERNGPAALFQEIDRISADHSKRRYLEAAFGSGRLQTDDMRRGFRSASRLSSDHDKANFLIQTCTEGLSADLRSQFFAVADSISSDHDRRRVISKAIAKAGNDAETMALASRSVQEMSSDHDKAEVLKQMPLPLVLSDARAREMILRAAGSIQSDHDKTGVLARMFETNAVGPESLPEVMRIAEGIQSDSDKSRLLERVPVELLSSTEARSRYFTAVRTIQSDNDRSKVLTGFVARSDRSAEVLEEICKSAEGIASDHEKANVLAASRSPLPAACFAAVRSISSDTDKRRVLERLLVSGASPENARAAVEAAGTLSSDHDKAEVLICAAQHYSDEPTRALIRKVAEGVSSDSDYRRVTSQLTDRTP